MSVDRGVARSLFKYRHNIIDSRRLRVKSLGESKVERSCALLEGPRRGGGVLAEYATERHMFNFVEMKALKKI